VRNPTPTDYDRVADAAIQSLPDGVSERLALIESLIAVLPEDSQRREWLALSREGLLTHERAQRKFLELMSEAKGAA
jgi:hypothetical protein